MAGGQRVERGRLVVRLWIRDAGFLLEGNGNSLKLTVVSGDTSTD